MSFTEEEVKRSADLKLWIESRIAELESELERLRETLLVVNSVLRVSSFKRADQVMPTQPSAEPISQAEAEPRLEVQHEEVKPLRRASDGMLLANAIISQSSISIVPSSDIKLSSSTPPFKSFFINRILEGMRAKDKEAIAQGRLKPQDILSYQVDEAEGIINKVVISNYMERNRLNEILNTATWCFTRMLEKQ